MSINAKALEKLEFAKILQRLGSFCLLSAGQEMAENLLPEIEIAPIRVNLEKTEEGKTLLDLQPLFSVRGVKDIRQYLARCRRGGLLNPDELLQVKDTLRVGRHIKQTISESKVLLPHFREMVAAIEPQKGLEDEISRCISEDRTVSDHASAELAGLRKNKQRLQQRIRETLDGIVRSATYQKMLQDPIITQRSDRYVVPVKQEYRVSFPGIVHDQSASGATLFIEPMNVVQLGNELRAVFIQEEREIQRILQVLAQAIDAQAQAIAWLFAALVEVDFVLAKARLARDMNAGAPKLVDRRMIRLIQARHPLLTGQAVPLTLELGGGFDLLVITGPNTGGKTVALKTMGLCVLMAQAGLHIPAESESVLGVFRQVFADIGDEQSLEQSLSTFSGHMKNIVEIAQQTDQSSLVLLDEIGAGTDPSEGAALAMAILSELLEAGSKVVATTHYGALKTFAYRTPRVENASVEFDADTLRPTYRLLIGIPGKSNAFNIAARLGLSGDVLARAKDYLSEREMQVSDLLENLEEIQRDIETEKRKVAEQRQVTEEQSRFAEQKLLQMEAHYERIVAKAQDEAGEIIRQTRRDADQLINELKEALKKDQKKQQDIERARTGIKSLQTKMAKPSAAHAAGGLPADQILLGQTVLISQGQQKGYVLKLPNEQGEVLVQAGIMKITVPLRDLRLVQEEKKPQKNQRVVSSGQIGREKAQEMRHELDVRGMLVEEACYALDKYLDDAVLTGIQQIYIIHGKGTGALRAGVQDFLRGHPHIQSFRLGYHGEGDLGVTVAELK
ncbi:MAG: endonuclease MutS2 [Peptococcaceae bacterium]|jgi:DNA mismatch repair protein MutS2|nr:endonuclease MutS2 [Peptococcaceae bacterium]